MSEFEINERVAEEICRTEEWNGRTFQVGEWVALLDGEVVAVARDGNVVLDTLRTLDSDPKRGMMFRVGPPTVDVIRRATLVGTELL